MTCRARHSRQRNLLEVDCTGCEAIPDLRKSKCLNGALLVLDFSMSIEAVVLSATVVKMYSAKTVELLSLMGTIIDTLSGFIIEVDRNVRSREELKQCRRCHLNPRRVLDELRAAFLADLTEFLTSIRVLLETSTELARPKCEMCLLQTKGAALTTLDQAMALRKFALKEGLGIVEV